MPVPRVSIISLMAGIVTIAIGLAALKYPTQLGADVLGTILQGSLIVAVLGVVLRRGRRQAFWIGFAVCGVGYTLLAFDLAPDPRSQRPQLATVDLLVMASRYLGGGSAGLAESFDASTTVNVYSWDLFSQTGHALLALLVAVLGGLLGRHFDDRSVTRPSSR